MTTKTKWMLMAGLSASGIVTLTVGCLIFVTVVQRVAAPDTESPEARATRLVQAAAEKNAGEVYELIAPSLRKQFMDNLISTRWERRDTIRSPRETFLSEVRLHLLRMFSRSEDASYRKFKVFGQDIEGGRAWIHFRSPEGEEGSVSMVKESGRWFFGL